MAYFTVSLNEHVIACAGSPEVSVLTATIVATARGAAQLTLNSLTTAGGEQRSEHWPLWNLSPQDQVCIAYTAAGKVTIPVSTGVEPDLPFDETLARLRQSFPQLPEPRAKAFSHTRAPRRACLSVTTDAGSGVEATLGDAELLQAVVCFVGATCNVEVHSLSVRSGGATNGVRWLVEQVEIGQSVRLTYTE